MTNSKHLEVIAKKAAEYILEGYGEELAIFKVFQYVSDFCAEMIDGKTDRSKAVKEYAINKVYSK